MGIIDLHCDTISMCANNSHYSLRNNSGHIDALRLRAGNVMAQCFAIYTPSDSVETAWAYYQSCVDVFHREINSNSDLIAQARSVSDIEHNESISRISAILTIEDSAALDGKIERLNRFYADGVRMASLTWNNENSLGYPNSSDFDKMFMGLKPFGIECVERMNELGIIVDVSHLSEGGFWDVYRYSSKPFAASHSCARALCDHPRNLTDEQLRAIANKGGIVGVNFVPSFLRNGSNMGRISDVVRHIKYIADVAGIDTVALGSDFDGYDDATEMKGCEDWPLLVDSLRSEFTLEEIDKISYKNAMRMFRSVES